VAALEGDSAVANVKASAAAQAERVAPFEDRYVSVLKEVLDDADHVGNGEIALEHRPGSWTT